MRNFLFSKNLNYSLLFNYNRLQNHNFARYFHFNSTDDMAPQLSFPPQPAPSWIHTPEEILSLTDRYIVSAKALDDKVAALKDVSIDSVIKPLAYFENENYSLVYQLSFYGAVSPSKEIRDASTKSEEKLDNYSIEAGLREDVFKQIDKIYKETQNNDALDAELKKLIWKLDVTYKRNGLELPIEERKEVEKISKELANLSLRYNKNLNEQTEYLLFTKEELDGVPEDTFNGFEKQVIDGVEKYKMTFKYPDIFPVLKYCKVSETRKRAYIGDQNKCTPENSDILAEVVKLRSIFAQKLGYKNYSEFTLEQRMAKTSKVVLDFLNDLRTKLQPLAKIELEKLLNLKKEVTNNKNEEKLYIWDQRYFDTLLIETEYKINHQKIAEYFPMENTVAKMLEIYEKLFNLKFVEINGPDKSVWHEEVKQFAVWKLDNAEEPEFSGYIYFDLYPREGKYGHAAKFGIAPGYFDPKTGKHVRPVCALVCNFTKSTKEKPSLLKHDEVETFFHELGHGIHDLMGKTQFARFHGTAVARDFVEAPSQMLEYWTWDKNILRNLSSHYQTGKQISDELLDDLIKTKHVNGAIFNLRQLHFGLFDMKLHTVESSEVGKLDILHEWNQMREDISMISNGGELTKGYGSFGHLLGGYASGYYGYLYSQVFAADIYYSIFKKDPMDPAAGKRYRDIILKRGGSKDEMKILEELLGRKPNSEAFLKELGIVYSTL
ncbi:metalloendopeptidase [Ascoidea rubescens DSM 1968]|uniref:Oligopeptidase n=1 Tax=Ascoidea rubescens DSM 1968 TaxID=1344418 RepID=A0A1D2VL15_9ASCO|nr:oligopeptidase [Ascoidea rubescens DSM 1968]ODV62301.1 oligopeptidase [Ascoidea rubescens DSM 1968]